MFVSDFLKRDKLCVLVPLHILNKVLKEINHVGESMDVRVNRERVHAGAPTVVEVVELSLVILLIHHLWAHVSRVVARLFDEQHRRDIVTIPANRNLDDIGFFTVLVWGHPRLGFLVVLDRLPVVTLAHIARLKLSLHQTGVIQEVVFFNEIGRVRAELPPRGAMADRFLTCQVLDEVDRDLNDVIFLLTREVGRILVRVAVDTDLVTGVSDCLDFLFECLDRVTGDEP